MILNWGIGRNFRVVVECFVSVCQMRLCIANFLDDLSLNHWVVRDGKLIQVRALQSRTTEENMFNVRDLNPNEEFVQIGDKRLMPVIAIAVSYTHLTLPTKA